MGGTRHSLLSSNESTTSTHPYAKHESIDWRLVPETIEHCVMTRAEKMMREKQRNKHHQRGRGTEATSSSTTSGTRTLTLTSGSKRGLEPTEAEARGRHPNVTFVAAAAAANVTSFFVDCKADRCWSASLRCVLSPQNDMSLAHLNSSR